MAIDTSPEPDEQAAPEPPKPEGEEASHERLRRNIAARLTRLITSEEGLRTMVSAVVPKDLLASTLEQVDATKSEAMAMVGRELRTFLAHLDVGDELAKILTAVSFEIRLEVRFIPNEDGTLRANVRGGAKPKIKVEPRRSRWKRRGGDDDADDADDADEAAGADADRGDEARRHEAREAAADVATDGDAARKNHEKTGNTGDQHAAESVDAYRPDLRRSSPPVDLPRGVDADADEEPERRPRHRLGRRAFTNMVERVADVAATTARVAAEVAADAAAEVVNEARRSRDDSDDLDDY